MDSGHCPGCTKVDPTNARVGHRTANEDRLKHPWEVDVGHITGPAREEAQILLAFHRNTDETEAPVIDGPSTKHPNLIGQLRQYRIMYTKRH
jgi:hypothetical protein